LISEAGRNALVAVLGERVRFDVPMSRHTSLRVGGPADAHATPGDRRELAALLGVCAEHSLPHTVLGHGFNTVVLDGGIEGVVLQLSSFRLLEERPGQRLRVEAGVSHSQLTRFCTQRGLSGLEFGAGIPGTVGGWLAMNAGIAEREIGDATHELEVMTPTGSGLRRLPRATLEFRYRGLRGLAPGSVIVSGLLEVVPTDPAVVRTEVERLLAKRAASQPLRVPSCGSVFKNPQGDYAGRLIEAAGLKGERVGDAEISELHANFIANRGRATAADVLALIERARERVAREFGIELEPEVHVLGRSR
jgi:UDP-N-acetylmuramate dehydrogenase